MFTQLDISNFKSIYNETINLAHVNVFIGENGSGKTNILESVAVASCAKESKLSNEDLFAKGVRAAKPELFSSSFAGINPKNEIQIVLQALDNTKIETLLVTENFAWKDKKMPSVEHLDTSSQPEMIRIISELHELESNEYFKQLKNYVIYSPSILELRGLHAESKKEPLGINGEGLDIEIARLSDDELTELKHFNYLISWLNDFEVDANDINKLKGLKPNRSTSKLYFSDRFMNEKNNFFSSENANEGVLHLLFYLTLFISPRTPGFFAIDNIESSLNPHLCRELMSIVCQLAKKHNKQVLITTHNPAILDGLNLFDETVHLFEVCRNDEGHTKTRRIQVKPEIADLEIGKRELKLSDLWTRGFLGAISHDF